MKNYHLVIVDLLCNPIIRIICLYRSFRPPGMLSPELFFSNQLAVIKNSLSNDCLIMGDFNLDASMSDRLDYNYKLPMKNLTNFALEANLTQLVTFNTWSRTIKGVKKESMLDHVYVRNFASVFNVTFSVPVFGDHVLVLIELNAKHTVNNETIQRRAWSSYLPIEMNNVLLNNLNANNVNLSDLNVQDCWNTIENIIINTVDKVAPMKKFPSNPPAKNVNVPSSIKQKINKRDRLLKQRYDTRHLPQIKSLSKEIKEYFRSKRLVR